MSNLNNLTSKILNDAKEEADKIVKSAEEKAKQKYDLEIKKAIAKKQTLLENARRERELLSDRIKSSANLKARNEKLQAKQTVINKVIDKLKEKLVNMNESDYINYLNQNIDKNSIAGKELIVKKEFADKVKQEFSTAKVKEDEFVTSGFIIEENGIQENYTFEVKLDFMRDELEVEISKLLFS
ncbi:V-type ATP synthase subunit E [Leptotrichia massiliensis]|uniref:V-type ATP synthase subunit E n=1 Tax=Leptotrichia massiliensis TaxID=1852388 RepID=UPI0028E21522|nr:V-type ATP synthase subunit E [Leptotrichia massiliensis]